MIEKILFVSDGIIAIMGNGNVPSGQMDKVVFDLTEYGVELRVSGVQIPIPAEALEHLEQAEGTNVHFYKSDPYALVAPYHSCIEISRDEILKLKGAWEYARPHQ
ncbi:MAG: hypothetical protein HZC44_01375 [Geobacter sp.]|nr:hypothetical protein [Geobacter sp.]